MGVPFFRNALLRLAGKSKLLKKTPVGAASDMCSLSKYYWVSRINLLNQPSRILILFSDIQANNDSLSICFSLLAAIALAKTIYISSRFAAVEH